MTPKVVCLASAPAWVNHLFHRAFAIVFWSSATLSTCGNRKASRKTYGKSAVATTSRRVPESSRSDKSRRRLRGVASTASGVFATRSALSR